MGTPLDLRFHRKNMIDLDTGGNTTMSSKNVLINKIDVKYREIENNDFQYQIMHKILSKFGNTDLQKILKACNIVQKQDALYNRK